MDLTDLIEICRAWDRMGWAVQSQIEAVADGAPIEDQNPAAMEMAVDWLRTVERIADETPGFYLDEDVADLIERIRDHLDARRQAATARVETVPA